MFYRIIFPFLNSLKIAKDLAYIPNLVHGFRDSVPVRKMNSCYQDTQHLHSYLRETRQLQFVDVNKPLQKVFRRVSTVYTYSCCMKNQLLYS